MELKTGYKQTEVGVIPSDWEVETIKNISAITTGSKNTQDRIEDGNYPFFVRSQVVERINSFSFDGEAILTAGDGVGTGKVFHYINGKFDFHQRVYKISDFKENINGFYFYLYFSNNFLNRIMQMTAKSSVDSVRMEIIAKMQIPIPSLAEQTAIATTLSDTDQYITHLEKLIAKKRNIKQGAMQELLKPKEGWVVRKLGEIAEIYTGKKNNQDKVENGLYPFFVRSQNVETINTYSFDGEAILIPGEGNIGQIFHYIHGKFDFHQRVYKISNFADGYSGKYVYRYMTEYFGRHAMENSVKATVDSLRLPTFQVFEIPLPKNIEEQTRIATILSDMDTELTTLETKLSKAQSIKQGMMQQLLTGKIRLI